MASLFLEPKGRKRAGKARETAAHGHLQRLGGEGRERERHYDKRSIKKKDKTEGLHTVLVVYQLSDVSKYHYQYNLYKKNPVGHDPLGQRPGPHVVDWTWGWLETSDIMMTLQCKHMAEFPQVQGSVVKVCT